MNRRYPCLITGLWLLARLSQAAAPWHPSLYLANDGYWPERVAVTVTNESEQAVAGAPLEVSLPALAGTRTEALRVCRADGVELLFDLRDAAQTPKRHGPLQANDRLIVPVECAAHQSTALFVYAGNAAAWPVPDFLPARMTNQTLHLAASVGALERLRLTKGSSIRTPPPAADWAEIQVRNLDDQPLASALVRVNLRAALARFSGAPAARQARVTLPDGSPVLSYGLGDGNDLLFPAQLPERSEQSYCLEFTRGAASSSADLLSAYEKLLGSSANRVANGNFETGDLAPDGWTTSVAPGKGQRMKAGFTTDARFGSRALELTVATNDQAAWVGWNSREIRVRPGAKYLLSGWIKAVELQGSATIHVHFHTATGALTQSGAMTSTQPSVGGNSEWVNTQAMIQAPPDASSVQLHLTMNTAGTLRHDGIVLCEIVDGSIAQVHAANEAATEALPTGELRVWEVNPLVKVFPDTPPQDRARSVTVELARNEFEPFQLAMRAPLGNTARVEVSVSPLRNDAGDSLPVVKVERVGFVPIDYPSAYYSSTVADWCRRVPQGAPATDGWAGWWPDPLAPGTRFDITHRQTQPVWFTVHAPKAAVPGAYHAEITLTCNGQETSRLPLTANVLPFTLPATTRLHAIFDFRFGPGHGFGSGADSPAQRQQWLRFMAEHRLGIDGIHPEPKFSYRDGKVTLDAREFDEAARFCFDELGMGVCYTPQFFYMFGWAYPPKKLFGLEPFSVEWTTAFQQAYRLFSEHIRERGWHDKFVYYISDEPHFEQAFVVEQMKKLCALIHGVDPSIPIYSSTWRHCAAWDQSLDLWGVGQYGCFPIDQMERLQKAGKQFWFTCDGQMATDTPYLATERMLPYYSFKYGVQGFEFWGLAWWTYDPWQTGWHQFIRQSDEGKKFYWIRYPDGDGFLAYPGKPVGVDGPVSTIRLEQVREGLEDYEALQMLADAVERARRTQRPFAAGERALQMARALVSIPNAGGLRSTEILPNPDQVPAVRKAVNAALVELSLTDRL